MPRQCMGGGGAEGSSGTRAATDKASVGSRRPAWHQVDHAGPRRGGVEEVLGRRAREACGAENPGHLGKEERWWHASTTRMAAAGRHDVAMECAHE